MEQKYYSKALLLSLSIMAINYSCFVYSTNCHVCFNRGLSSLTKSETDKIDTFASLLSLRRSDKADCTSCKKCKSASTTIKQNGRHKSTIYLPRNSRCLVSIMSFQLIIVDI